MWWNQIAIKLLASYPDIFFSQLILENSNFYQKYLFIANVNEEQY